MRERMGISVREFARRLGVTENAVRSRIKAGKRIAEAVYPDGSLDPDEASALWWVDMDVERMRSQPPDEAAIYEAAKRGKFRADDATRLKVERMSVDLEAAKINLESLRRNTIDRDVAKRAVANLMRMHRDTVLGFANRYGAEIAAEVGCDPRLLIPALEEKLRAMLADARVTQDALAE